MRMRERGRRTRRHGQRKRRQRHEETQRTNWVRKRRAYTIREIGNRRRKKKKGGGGGGGEGGAWRTKKREMCRDEATAWQRHPWRLHANCVID